MCVCVCVCVCVYVCVCVCVCVCVGVWVGGFCLFAVMFFVVVVPHVGLFECFPNPSSSDIQVYSTVNE